MKKLSLIKSLALAGLLLSNSAFALNMGGATIQPQQSKAYKLKDYKLNPYSKYNISCIANLPASAKESVRIKVSEISAFYGNIYFGNEDPKEEGILEPGSEVEFGAKYMNANLPDGDSTEFIITNTSETQPVNVSCQAIMS